MNTNIKINELEEIPDFWRVTKINDFAEILDNLRVPISSEIRSTMKGDYPYCGANGIVDYINDYKFDGEFVLMAEDGGNFHEYQTRPIAYMMNGKFWVNNHAHVLRAKNGMTKFLFYSLEHKDITKYIIGSTRTKLNRSVLETIPIAEPPLQEQQKIAEILSTIDDKIDVIDAKIVKIQQLKKGLVLHLMTSGIGYNKFKNSALGKIPETWNTIRLEEISDFITKGSTPTTYGFGWVDVGILFLRSECVGPEKFTMSGSMMISPEAHNAMVRSQIKGGDILMTITGNVGRVCILPNNVKQANINQHIARIRIISPKAVSDFVYAYLSQSQIISAYNKITTGQAYPQLSLKQVRETLVPLPPMDEQRKIIETLNPFYEKEEVLQEKKEVYTRFKKGLAQHLLTGKIRVNNLINIKAFA